MTTLKVTATGLEVPQEMIQRLNVKPGDTVFAIETETGYLLTPFDPEVEEEVEFGREFMRRYDETFRALAK